MSRFYGSLCILQARGTLNDRKSYLTHYRLNQPNIIRWPHDSRQVLCFTAKIFSTTDLNFPDCRASPHQKCIGGLAQAELVKLTRTFRPPLPYLYIKSIWVYRNRWIVKIHFRSNLKWRTAPKLDIF